MIMATVGEPIWLREGVFVIKTLSETNSGLPVGTFLSKPSRGIFLDRKTYLSKAYIKAYVENLGERFIDEDEVQDMKNMEIKNVG
jgi:hypothetical protein